MILSRIGQVSIPVSDQQRALEFYTQKLGWNVTTDVSFGEGQRWIELQIPGAETQLVLYTADEHKDRIGSFSDIMFVSPDLNQTYQALQAQQVEIAQPPTVEPWGAFLMFKDPDGNRFLVSGPLN